MQIVVENGRAHKVGDFEEGHSIDWDWGVGGGEWRTPEERILLAKTLFLKVFQCLHRKKTEGLVCYLRVLQLCSQQGVSS